MSEYGRGYATCLRQFSNHRIRLLEFVVTYENAQKKEAPGSDLFRPAMAATLWMNGASDHLYDLVRPKRGVSNATWAKAKFVQQDALSIGHGFLRESSPEECEALLDAADQLLWLTQTETLDEALAWDTDHGLKPETGDWSCPYDLVKVFLK